MKLSYSSDLPDAATFKALYDTTNWGPVTRETGFYSASLLGSWASFAAYDAEQLVGFVRVISDGKLHAFVTEMIVHPEYQGSGIGKQLLNAILKKCLAGGITDIQLFCARGKAAFYLQGGFIPRPEDAPGMQYKPERDI